MIFMQDNIITFVLSESSLIIGIFAICTLVFLFEVYKFLRYKTRSEILEFSLLGMVFFGTNYLFEDLFLSALSVALVLMVIGVYELRESPIWVRLMATFTVSYAYVLIAVLLEKLVASQHWEKLLGIQKATQISGFALSTTLWVLLIFLVIFFGRKFILVSRFLSPQYVYLFLYGVVYLIIASFDLNPQIRYLLFFLVNIFLYLISGFVLQTLFGVKPLKDERVLKLVQEIQNGLDKQNRGIKRFFLSSRVRAVGITKAPIINAFAYGPFFDQRIAFIIDDINNFSDDEIRGIVTHELAHLRYKHTLLILGLGFFDLAFRFIFHIPVSTYDFAVGINGSWSIASYYIFDIIMFAFIVIFIRMMEAQADRATINLGYGKELAQSLYHLEGFYQGVAGEIGMNATLLTNKKRTPNEEKRFNGDAANELYLKLMEPSRSSMVMNLIVSHPPTTYRIAAVLNPEKIGIRKLALLPILLILPITRKRNIKLLQEQNKSFNLLLTEKYIKEWGSIDNYRNTTLQQIYYSHYVDRQILYIKKYGFDDEKKTILPKVGYVQKIISKNSIIEPYIFSITQEDGEILEISPKEYFIKIYEPNNWYVLKNLQIAQLEHYYLEKSKIKFLYRQGTKSLKASYLGSPIIDIFNENKLIFYSSRGKTSVLQILTINTMKCPEWIESLDKTNKSDYNIKNWNIEVQSLTTKERFLLKGKDQILLLPPNFIPIYKRLNKQNLDLVNSLAAHNIPLTLYSSVDPDIGIPCMFKIYTNEPVNEGKIQYITPGEAEEYSIHVKQLDGIVVRYPYYLLIPRKENSLFTRFVMSLSNRSQMKYAF